MPLERKLRRPPTTSTARHEHTERTHNRDAPRCCRLLDAAARDVLGGPSEPHNERETATTALAPLLVNVIRQVLRDELQPTKTAFGGQGLAHTTPIPTNGNDNPNGGKKRRKKKKNKSTNKHDHEDEKSDSVPPTQSSGEPAPPTGHTVTEEENTFPDKSPRSTFLQNPSLRRYLASQPSLFSSSSPESNSDLLEPFLELWNRRSRENVNVCSQADVQRLIAAIACEACRREVAHVLEVYARVDHVPRTAPAVPDRLGSVDPNVFDYVAMEEGIARTRALYADQILRFELVPSADGHSVGWRLRRSCTDLSQPWSRADFQTLVEDFILLGGVPMDEWRGADAGLVSESTWESLYVSVDSRTTATMGSLTSLLRQVQDHAQTLHDMPTVDNNIDMKAPTVFQDIDESLCSLLAQVLRIVTETTRSYLNILTHLGGQHTASRVDEAHPTVLRADAVTTLDWAHQGVTLCWQAYGRALDRILQAVTVYEIQWTSMADRHGVLPKLFVSSTTRKLYRNMLNVKLQAVVAAIDQVRNVLDQVELVDAQVQPQWTTSFGRKLYAVEAFYQVVASSQGGKHCAKKPSDIATEDVLYDFREWTETVHQHAVNGILEVHQTRREKALRLWRSLQGELPAGDSDVADHAAVDTPAILRLEEALAGPDTTIDSLQALRRLVAPGLLCTVNLWLSLRRGDSKDTFESQRPAVLPLSFLQWIAGRNLDQSNSQYCLGSDGKDRAACILVALLFRWLSDRCLEWQAEMAEQELLQAMDSFLEEPGATGKAGVPNKKKSKKKKDKKTASSVKATTLQITPKATTDLEVEHTNLDTKDIVLSDLDECKGKGETAVSSTEPETTKAGEPLESQSPLEQLSDLVQRPKIPEQNGKITFASGVADSDELEAKVIKEAKISNAPKKKVKTNTKKSNRFARERGKMVEEDPKEAQKNGDRSSDEADSMLAKKHTEIQRTASLGPEQKAAGHDENPRIDQACVRDDLDLDKLVNSGVWDGPRVQLAEDFFVERLLAVLDEGNYTIL